MNAKSLVKKQKHCIICASAFCCGDSIESVCWCNAYPNVFKVDYASDCLCQVCLHKSIKEKTEAYVTEIALTGIKNNIATTLQKSDSLILGIDYYIENNLGVFTAWHHLRRGLCCKSNCRHCPYGFKK